MALKDKEQLEYLPRREKTNEYKYLNEPIIVEDNVEKIRRIQLPANTDSGWDKIKKRIKHNPFAPLGLLFVTGCMIGGIYTIKTGNDFLNSRFQKLRLWGTVFTVIAAMVGQQHWEELKRREAEEFYKQQQQQETQ